jgi:5'-nucleotidase
MVVSGHTHSAYNCLLPNSDETSIPVSSASSFGRLVTDIDMTLRLSERQADVHRGRQQHRLPRRPGCRGGHAGRRTYQTAVAPIANAVVGSITANITRTGSAAGEVCIG